MNDLKVLTTVACLAAGLNCTTAAVAQSAAADANAQKLQGVWLVQIGESVGALHIGKVDLAADGSFKIDATYSNASAKARLDHVAAPMKLEITTAAGTVLNLTESSPDAWAGTFTARGGSGAVSAARFAPRRNADVAAKCGLSEGLWAGTWSVGNLGAWTLYLSEVGSDCSAVVRYGRVKQTVTLEPGGFSFICNPNTNGTCRFKPSGKDLWVSYSNPMGGSNNAVFKPVE
jgi:hypothetical protein